MQTIAPQSNAGYNPGLGKTKILTPWEAFGGYKEKVKPDPSLPSVEFSPISVFGQYYAEFITSLLFKYGFLTWKNNKYYILAGYEYLIKDITNIIRDTSQNDRRKDLIIEIIQSVATSETGPDKRSTNQHEAVLGFREVIVKKWVEKYVKTHKMLSLLNILKFNFEHSIEDIHLQYLRDNLRGIPGDDQVLEILMLVINTCHLILKMQEKYSGAIFGANFDAELYNFAYNADTYLSRVSADKRSEYSNIITEFIFTKLGNLLPPSRAIKSTFRNILLGNRQAYNKFES